MSSQRRKDALFGRYIIVIDHQLLQSMLRNVSGYTVQFVHTDSIYMQGCLVSSKDGLGNDLCIPVNANILSSLVEAHAKGQSGSFGTIKDAYNGVQQSKHVFVILDAVQTDATGIDQLQLRIIY